MNPFAQTHPSTREETGAPFERDLGAFTIVASSNGAGLLTRAGTLLLREERPLLIASIAPSEERLASLAETPPPPGARVGFLTSGSTGTPKAIWKSWRCLEAEASALADLLATGPNGCDAAPKEACVVALVPPCHLYGFLFAGLLPARIGRKVCYVEPGTPPDRVPEAALLVAVPALFPYCAELAAASRVSGRTVFSGAPLGAARRAEADAAFPRGAFEVLGSTETGGMGVSRARDEQARYFPIPGVVIETVPGHDGEDLVRLRSPFLFPEGRGLELDDRIAMHSDGSFTHHGRRDRVFKYAGRRHATGEIEEALRLLCAGAATRAFFLEDAGHAKGGRLIAFVATDEPVSLRALRSEWLARFPLPFPHEIRFVPQFPHDSMGKVTLETLLKA